MRLCVRVHTDGPACVYSVLAGARSKCLIERLVGFFSCVSGRIRDFVSGIVECFAGLFHYASLFASHER